MLTCCSFLGRHFLLAFSMAERHWMFGGFAELHGVSGLKPAEVQDAVCSKAMALCSIVTHYNAAPVPDGKPATIDAFLTRLIRRALHHPQGYVPLQYPQRAKGVLLLVLLQCRGCGFQ